MTTDIHSTTASRAADADAGNDLRTQVEALGTAIANRLSAVVSNVPSRPSGPQALGRALDMTTVTASRLLKALGQGDPVAVLQLLPGPNPLGKMVEAAKAAGTDAGLCDAALVEITAFDELIRTEAGDRGSLKAMLSAWLPEDRREFEAQRRQTIFKALTELDGVSCEFELSTMIVGPSQDKERPRTLDLISVKALLSIDRIRPDATVKLATRRLTRDSEEQAADGTPPRVPLNLDGEPALDGLHTVRLDEYCTARPAPIQAQEFGSYVQYALGPTGFGRRSKVDIVIAEVNRSEPIHREPGAENPPYFFVAPEMATRKVVFDLFVHEDVFPGSVPEIIAYDTTAMGPAIANDPARDLDRRHFPEPLASLGRGSQRARLLEFPRYTELLEDVASKLDLDLTQHRLYRVTLNYPLVGNQITLAFTGSRTTE